MEKFHHDHRVLLFACMLLVSFNSKRWNWVLLLLLLHAVHMWSISCVSISETFAFRPKTVLTHASQSFSSNNRFSTAFTFNALIYSIHFSAQIFLFFFLPSTTVNNILIAWSMFFFRFRPVFHICVVCVLLNVTICHSETQLLFFSYAVCFFFQTHIVPIVQRQRHHTKLNQTKESLLHTNNFHSFTHNAVFSYDLHFDMSQHHCTRTFPNKTKKHTTYHVTEIA